MKLIYFVVTLLIFYMLSGCNNIVSEDEDKVYNNISNDGKENMSENRDEINITKEMEEDEEEKEKKEEREKKYKKNKEFDIENYFPFGKDDLKVKIRNNKICLGDNYEDIKKVLGDPLKIIDKGDYDGQITYLYYPKVELGFIENRLKDKNKTLEKFTSLFSIKILEKDVLVSRNIEIGDRWEEVIKKFPIENETITSSPANEYPYEKNLYSIEDIDDDVYYSYGRGIVYFDKNKNPKLIKYDLYPDVGIELIIENEVVVEIKLFKQIT